MNVLNRNMFRNRDSRNRLAQMGGILSSSPELQETAMTFANGGGADLPDYIINVPGLTAEGVGGQEAARAAGLSLRQARDILRRRRE